MPWLTLPHVSLADARKLAPAVERELVTGRKRVLAALVKDTPVDSGTMRSSWVGEGKTVTNTARYARYVAVDSARADAVIADTDAAIGERIDKLFGGGV